MSYIDLSVTGQGDTVDSSLKRGARYDFVCRHCDWKCEGCASYEVGESALAIHLKTAHADLAGAPSIKLKETRKS